MFMVPQIVETDWQDFEDKYGERSSIPAEFSAFVEDMEKDGEVYGGFGARLSAPGYLDCTDWVVCDTFEDARHHLLETFADDDSEMEEAIENL